MQKLLNALINIIFSISINVCFAYLLFLLVSSVFFHGGKLNFPSYLVTLYFGFWNGLIIGLMPSEFVRTIQQKFAYSFSISFINSVFWWIFIIAFNKFIAGADSRFDSQLILIIIYIGFIFSVSNILSLFLLTKIPLKKYPV